MCADYDASEALTEASAEALAEALAETSLAWPDQISGLATRD